MPIIRISNESFQSVPVFPLENVQLFPHTILPLTIFEPRYLSMVDYALENDHLLTIADTVLSDDQIHDDPDRPSIRPILGAGVIIAKQQIAPNRYQILVQGVTRVIMRDELEQTMPFRQVHAEILLDEETDEIGLGEVEDRLRELIGHFAVHNESQSKALYELLENSPNADILGNMISANIVSAPALRQTLFEELNPLNRLKMIYQHIGDLLLQSETTTSSDLIH
jgi:uncharacterized protein